MRYAILAIAMSLSIGACTAPPTTSQIESGLCTVQDQLDGVCSGPFALLPQYTRDYAVSVVPEADIDEAQQGNISCGVLGSSNTVMCVLDLDFPVRYTVICTKEGNNAPVCSSGTPSDCKRSPCFPPDMVTGSDSGGGGSLCTVQDQIDGRCSGPFSLLAEYTRDYAAESGYDNVPQSSLECHNKQFSSVCQLTLDVPGYKIVITCEIWDVDGSTSCTMHQE